VYNVINTNQVYNVINTNQVYNVINTNQVFLVHWILEYSKATLLM